MGLGWTILKMLAIYEGSIAIKENIERHKHFNDARAYCEQIGKPLLVVGMKRHVWEPPNGDVTLDIDPAVERINGGVWADEREIPFDDKIFGAVYNAHTLEHLASVDDIQLAVDECVRVADEAVFLCPSPYSIYSNFFCPAHNFRIWFDPMLNQIRVVDNRFQTGLGFQPGAGDTTHPPPNTRGVASSMVVTESPRVMKIGSAYIVSG